MKREIITIPSGFLKPVDMNWRIDWRGQSSGESNNGITQMVVNGFPRWVGDPKIVLFKDSILQWRAISARARGRTGLYRVRISDPLGFDDAVVSAQFAATGVPLSNEQTFNTGLGLAFAPFVTCAAGAAKGATEITVTVESNIPDPKVGQIMSYDDRPFIVVAVDDLGSGQFTLTIEMPLRVAIPVDGLIDLNATGVFEAATEGMGSPGYDRSNSSRPTLHFQEYLNR